MKIACTVLVLSWAALLQAEGAVIHSPNTAQTYAFHSIQWEQLRWLPDQQQLVASITFSNLNYDSRAEPRQDERFDFALPGVTLDPGSGVFFVIGRHGERIPVARRLSTLIGSEIKLLPGAKIDIHSKEGQISVDLLTNQPNTDPQWFEQNH